MGSAILHCQTLPLERAFCVLLWMPHWAFKGIRHLIILLMDPELTVISPLSQSLLLLFCQGYLWSILLWGFFTGRTATCFPSQFTTLWLKHPQSNLSPKKPSIICYLNILKLRPISPLKSQRKWFVGEVWHLPSNVWKKYQQILKCLTRHRSKAHFHIFNSHLFRLWVAYVFLWSYDTWI